MRFAMPFFSSCLMLLWLSVLAAITVGSQAQLIVSVAGGGVGDGKPAVEASMLSPTGVALDVMTSALYVADGGFSRIRRVQSNGIIDTVAGSGAGGYDGDGGAATASMLNRPSGVLFDESTSILYIADRFNNRIRMVPSDANIYTIAGNGTAAFSGDGGSGTSATLFNPFGLTHDSVSNALFIADTQNSRIRKLDLGTGIITTVCGDGQARYAGDNGPATSASLGYPTGVAYNAFASSLFIADQANLYIRCVLGNGTIITVAGTGGSVYAGDGILATLAGLNYPFAVAYDVGSASLFVADNVNSAVRHILANKTIFTVAGTTGVSGFSGDGGNAKLATLNSPSGVVYDAITASTFIADTSNNCIRRVTSDGIMHTFAGVGGARQFGDSGPATSVSFVYPRALFYDDTTSSLLITDSYGHNVRRLLGNGTIVTLMGGLGVANFSGDNGPAAAATLNTPSGIAVNTAGVIVIADKSNHRIRKIDTDGMVSTYAGTGVPQYADNSVATAASFNSPMGLAYDSSNDRIFVADWGNNRVRCILGNGSVVTIAGNGSSGQYTGDGGSATAAAIDGPADVEYNAARGLLYIADQNNHVVRAVYSNGTITTVAGVGRVSGSSGDGGPAALATLNQPLGIAWDNVQHILYIADTYNNRIRAVLPNGTIIGIAGTGAQAFSGENTLAITAAMYRPAAIAIRSSASVYVADTYNHRVREIFLPSPTPTASPSYSPSASYTAAISVSTTRTTTPSPSASVTTSASVTNTVTGSASPSPSVSSSYAASGSTSLSSTGTPTAMTTTSPVPSTSVSPSASTSVQPSASMTVTQTVTPTPTHSHEALALTLGTDDSGALATNQAAVVSDSLPPTGLQLNVSYCVEDCGVSCTVVSSNSTAVTPQRFIVPTWPNTPSPVSSLLKTWVPFGACQSSMQSDDMLQCRVHDVTVQQALHCLPTRWPLLDDIVVELPSGLYKSAWSPAVNLSSKVNNSDALGWAPLTAWIQQQSQQAQQQQQTQKNTGSKTGRGPFVVPTTGIGAFMLVASQIGGGHPFDTRTTVRVENQPCNVSWVSPDGNMLRFTLPPPASFCPPEDDSADCGYVQLTVTTASDTTARGASLSCPPFCPEDFPGSVPFMQVETGSMVPADASDATQPPVPLALSSLPSTGLYVTKACTAAGFFDPSLGFCTNSSDPRYSLCAFGAGEYCRACPSGALCPGGFRAWPLRGFYTPAENSGSVIECPSPSSQRCLGWNASTASVQCGDAYRTGSYVCGACASGYYPDLDTTCTNCPSAGNNIADILAPVATFCAGLLAACAAVYGFAILLATVRRATREGLAKRVLQLGAWTFTTVQVVSQVGQAASAGLPAMVLAVYNQLAIFQFSGVALPSACVPGFPFVNEVASMASALGLLTCMVVLIWTLLKSGSPPNKSKCRAVLAALLRLLAVGLAVLYPTATNSAMGLLYCTPAVVSQRAYAALTSNSLVASTGNLLFSRGGGAAVTVTLLASNPSHVCYEGAHQPAAILAWVTLWVYCIGYPIAVVMFLNARIRIIMRGSKGKTTSHVANPLPITRVKVASPSVQPQPSKTTSQQIKLTCGSCKSPSRDTDNCSAVLSDRILAPYVSADYRPSRHWFACVDRMAILLLAIINTTLHNNTAPTLKFVATLFVLITLLTLLLWYRPYPSVANWKFIVKMYSLMLSAVAAILNLVAAIDAGDATMTPLGYVAVVGSIGLFIALAVAFFADLLRSMPLASKNLKRVGVASGGKSESPWMQANPMGITEKTPTLRSAVSVRRVFADDQPISPRKVTASSHLTFEEAEGPPRDRRISYGAVAAVSRRSMSTRQMK